MSASSTKVPSLIDPLPRKNDRNYEATIKFISKLIEERKQQALNGADKTGTDHKFVRLITLGKNMECFRDQVSGHIYRPARSDCCTKPNCGNKASGFQDSTNAQDKLDDKPKPATKHGRVDEDGANIKDPHFEGHYWMQAVMLMVVMTVICGAAIGRIALIDTKPFVNDFPEVITVGEVHVPFVSLSDGVISMHDFAYDNRVGALIATESLTYGNFYIDAERPLVVGTRLRMIDGAEPTIGRIKFGKNVSVDEYFLPWEPGQSLALPSKFYVTVRVTNVALVDTTGASGRIGEHEHPSKTPAKLLSDESSKNVVIGDDTKLVLGDGKLCVKTGDTERTIVDGVTSFDAVVRAGFSVSFVALAGERLLFGACFDTACVSERIVDISNACSQRGTSVALKMDMIGLPEIEIRLETGETRTVRCSHPMCLDAM